VAHGAAGEARQAGDVGGAVKGKLLFEEAQRVGVLEFARPGLGQDVVDLHAPAVGLEAQEGASAEETVAPEALAADNALEEKGPVAFLDLAEGADGRERIADELAVDRHHAGLPGELDELLEGRSEERRVGKECRLWWCGGQ